MVRRCGQGSQGNAEDQVLTLKAKIAGVPDATEAYVTVFLKLREGGGSAVFEGSALVTSGANRAGLEIRTQEIPHEIKDHTTLDKIGEDYYHPELYFQVQCKGRCGIPGHPIAHALVLFYESAPE